MGLEVGDDAGEDQKIVRGGGEKWRASGRMRRAPDRDPAWPRWAGGQCPSSRPETGHNREKACRPRSGGEARSHILSLEGQAEPPSQMQGVERGADRPIWEDETPADLAVDVRVLRNAGEPLTQRPTLPRRRQLIREVVPGSPRSGAGRQGRGRRQPTLRRWTSQWTCCLHPPSTHSTPAVDSTLLFSREDAKLF